MNNRNIYIRIRDGPENGLIFMRKSMKRARNANVTEWEVVGIIIALVSFSIAVGTPIIKLNTSITRLIERLENLDEGLGDLEAKNHSSHQRLWKHNDGQDEELKDHETRISILEEKEK